MGKFDHTLAVAAKRDKSQWELGDALIEDIGPPTDDGVRDGSYAKLQEVAGVLAEEGYDYTTGYLSKLRDISYKFVPRTRVRAASWTVHCLAQSPEMLDVIIKSARLREGQRLTYRKAQAILEAIKQRDHDEAKEKARAQGREPPQKSRKTKPPQNDKPVSPSKVATMIAAQKITALIVRAQTIEKEARGLMEENLDTLVPEAYDAIVEQSLVVVERWREFTKIAQTNRNPRGHLSVASTNG